MSDRDELADVIVTGIFDTSDAENLGLADAILAAGYRKPPVIDRAKLRIDNGYLELEVDHCTCGGYGEPHYAHENGCGLEPLYDISAALDKAGYWKPRTVTTVEELDALPAGSVLLDPIGISLHKNAFTGWRASNGAKDIPLEILAADGLPATVLYTPEPQS